MHICFLGLPTEILKNLGAIENTFPMVYYMPPIFQNYSRKTKKTKKKQICSHLVTANQGG
jgi:hypothetical protein